MGSARGRCTIDHEIVATSEELRFERIAQTRQVQLRTTVVPQNHRYRLAQRQAQQHGFRSGAEAVLLKAAVKEWLELCAASQEQRANSGGTVEFVRRERQRVDAQRVEVDGQLADCLDRVAMQQHAMLLTDSSHLADRLHD